MDFTIPPDHLERWLSIQRRLDVLSSLPDGYLDSVLRFAQEAGKLDSLFTGFESIARLAGNDDEPARLMPDFAPQSFTFATRHLFGGLIFHGQHDGGGSGGAPTFSVCLNPVDGWAIHT